MRACVSVCACVRASVCVRVCVSTYLALHERVSLLHLLPLHGCAAAQLLQLHGSKILGQTAAIKTKQEVAPNESQTSAGTTEQNPQTNQDHAHTQTHRDTLRYSVTHRHTHTCVCRVGLDDDSRSNGLAHIHELSHTSIPASRHARRQARTPHLGGDSLHVGLQISEQVGALVEVRVLSVHVCEHLKQSDFLGQISFFWTKSRVRSHLSPSTWLESRTSQVNSIGLVQFECLSDNFVPSHFTRNTTRTLVSVVVVGCHMCPHISVCA